MISHGEECVCLNDEENTQNLNKRPWDFFRTKFIWFLEFFSAYFCFDFSPIQPRGLKRRNRFALAKLTHIQRPATTTRRHRRRATNVHTSPNTSRIIKNVEINQKTLKASNKFGNRTWMWDNTSSFRITFFCFRWSLRLNSIRSRLGLFTLNPLSYNNIPPFAKIGAVSGISQNSRN